MSIFQLAWAVKATPSLINTSPSNITSATKCIPGTARVLSRGSRKWLSWQLCKHVDPPQKSCPRVCVPYMPTTISPQTFRDTVPSTCWVLWQPFAVSILSLQICCLLGSSAESKHRDCSDMPTDLALLLHRQPSNPCFQTKHSLHLFKNSPLIPPSIHPSRTQK